MSTLFKNIAEKDLAILKLFNIRIKCKPLDIIMPAATYLGSSIFCALFCIVAIFNKDPLIHILGMKTSISLVLSTLISKVVKSNINRLRPFITVANLNIKKIGIDKYSFPSGHTTAAFGIATMLSLFLPAHTFIFILLAAIVGISRMYLGVHYPSDVLAGSILGSSISLIIYYLV